VRAEFEDKISNDEKRVWTPIRVFRMTEIRVTELSKTVRIVNINIQLTVIEYSLL